MVSFSKLDRQTDSYFKISLSSLLSACGRDAKTAAVLSPSAVSDLCSLHSEIKSESNLITEEQKTSFKSWAVLGSSITFSIKGSAAGPTHGRQDKALWEGFTRELEIDELDIFPPARGSGAVLCSVPGGTCVSAVSSSRGPESRRTALLPVGPQLKMILPSGSSQCLESNP